MVASTTYVAAHDHDDHQSEYGGECVVCTVAAVGVAKASPDALTVIAPNERWTKAPQPERMVVAVRFNARPYPARGPPLSVSS